MSDERYVAVPERVLQRCQAASFKLMISYQRGELEFRRAELDAFADPDFEETLRTLLFGHENDVEFP